MLWSPCFPESAGRRNQPLAFLRRHLVEVLEELLPVRTNRAVGREHLVVTAGGLRIDCE